MSMNIYIRAVRQVQVIKTGKIVEQTETFHAWQTPTKDSNAIFAAPDPIEAYKDWVKKNSRDYEENIYRDDDIWQEGEPIGTQTVNSGTSHLIELEEWIMQCENEGYDIEVSIG